MKTKEIQHGDIRLVVSEATTLIGMRRTRLILEAAEIKDTDPDRYVLRRVVYPSLVAAVVEAEGVVWPVDFDTFLELPETLEIEWERAVAELNPHWQVQADDEAGEKKQPMTSADD